LDPPLKTSGVWDNHPGPSVGQPQSSQRGLCSAGGVTLCICCKLIFSVTILDLRWWDHIENIGLRTWYAERAKAHVSEEAWVVMWEMGRFWHCRSLHIANETLYEALDSVSRQLWFFCEIQSELPELRIWNKEGDSVPLCGLTCVLSHFNCDLYWLQQESIRVVCSCSRFTA